MFAWRTAQMGGWGRETAGDRRTLAKRWAVLRPRPALPPADRKGEWGRGMGGWGRGKGEEARRRRAARGEGRAIGEARTCDEDVLSSDIEPRGAHALVHLHQLKERASAGGG